MSYITARDYAKKAASLAESAKGRADDDGVEKLAEAVASLSKAVAELASQLHRDS